MKYFRQLILIFLIAGWASAASAATLYRSVGTTATNLNTTSRTVTITGTTAYFSASMPDKVGVGDAIVYGTTNIAFISARLNNCSYTVQNATGGAPTPAAAGTTAGVYRCFNSMVNWEGNTTANTNIDAAVRASVLMSNLNLVTAGHIVMVPCYGDGVDSSTMVSVSGWTTGVNNYIKIYTPVTAAEVGVSQRHSGTWNTTGKYAIEASASGADRWVISLMTSYIRVEGLQVYVNYSASKYCGGIAVNGSSSGEARISDNIVKGQLGGSGALENIGLEDWNNTSYVTKMWNNIVYDFTGGTAGGAVGIWTDNQTTYLYNNTVVNCVTGIYRDTASGSLVAKNNIVQDCTDGYLGTFAAASDFNISNLNATDAPNATFTNDYVTVSFVNSAGKDFHLQSSDTGARDNGADLSADANIAFTTDIDLNRRALGSAWDIGADESPSGLTTIYRSVGTTATNLNTSTRTVTISGTTATFSGAMPDNVGVGDALVYGSTNIAFISGRTSSTVYTVQNATGGTPVAASGAAVGVYRCYQSLRAWESSLLDQENVNINAAVDDYVPLAIKNLVTPNHVMMVPCYGDGIDTNGVTIARWTTASSNYIKIYTPTTSSEVGVTQRHAGKWDNGKYSLQATASPEGTGTLSFKSPYIWVDGLQVYHTNAAASGSALEGFWGTVGAWGYVSNSLIRGAGTYTSSGYGLGLDHWGGSTFYLWNNMFYDFYKAAGEYGAIGSYLANSAVVAYNNTIYGCGLGFETDGVGTMVAKNNLIANTLNPYINTFAAGTDYNATDINDTPGVGANNRINQTFSFVDAAGKDFHLLSSDVGAKNNGTDLSADAGRSFSTDIDGETRPIAAIWDIGADEAPRGLLRSAVLISD